tara:strand:- start:2651 stop:3826 length:1176 start_codon:yes stop_codon:yes gene_type:complete
MKTLFDLGACVGDFTTSWLEKNPDGNVVCVEPDPENLRILKEKFGMHANVKIIHACISTESGTSTFYRGTSTTNGSMDLETEALRRLDAPEEISVRTLSVPELFHECGVSHSNSVVKIDIEGFEHRVLCQMLDQDIIPLDVYMEDGCRKTTTLEEWKARLDFYKKVEKLNILDRFAFETSAEAGTRHLLMPRDSRDNPGRIIGYVGVNGWYAYKKIKNPEFAIAEFLDEGRCLFTNAIELVAQRNVYPGVVDYDTAHSFLADANEYAFCLFAGPFKQLVACPNAAPGEEHHVLLHTLRELDFNTGRSDLVTEIPLGMAMIPEKGGSFSCMPLLTTAINVTVDEVLDSRIWKAAAKAYFDLHPEYHTITRHMLKMVGVPEDRIPYPSMQSFK